MGQLSTRVDEFREAVRHLWNTYGQTGISKMSYEKLEIFDEIEGALFDFLVIAPSDESAPRGSYRNQKSGLVEISIDRSLLEYSFTVEARDKNNNSTWHSRDVSGRVSELRFRLIDFFDWNLSGHRDLQYLRAEVLCCPQLSEIVGKVAMLRVEHLSYHWCPKTRDNHLGDSQAE